MCGGVILSDNVTVPPRRRILLTKLWLEGRRPRCAGDVKRRRSPLEVEDEKAAEDFDADFEEFETESGDEGVGVVVEGKAKPFSAPASVLIEGIPHHQQGRERPNSGVSATSMEVPKIVDTEEKPIVKPAVNNPVVQHTMPEPVMQTQNIAPLANLYSDQGSNSFNSSDFNQEQGLQFRT
ncbi:hypothetical protein U9M48_014247 [Paspalum notatum var. saurae]|uniref:Uncharacterized protein n=1 Tax=Paspalum notatum var. saurae TaxID=547442 RepID=A0AAQ3T197_PASNO